jgi:type IV pilus assembly protein PilM
MYPLPLTALTRAFPTPHYMRMHGAGIDISSTSIKTVQLSGEGKHMRLHSYQKMSLEPGIITQGDIEQPEKLVDVLRTLRLRERIYRAHASLLEKKAYVYQTLVPKESLTMRSAAEFSLEDNVPIPPSDIVFDYEVVRKVEQGTVISVTAYAARIIHAYQEAFQKAGIMLLSLETESQAQTRALITSAVKNETVLLVDFGKDTTRIAVADSGVASFSATVDVGGDALTSAIMKHFGCTTEEAEVIKNEKGFFEGQKDEGLFETLMSTISVLRDELIHHILYWNNSNDGGVAHRPIQYVYLSGGNANLKGLAEFLSRALNLPVMVGNPWGNAFSLDEYIPAMPKNESLQYTTTIGLALRSQSRLW